MKTMNLIKKTVAGVAAVAVIMAGVIVVPAEDVNAATEGAAVPKTGVVYSDTKVSIANVPEKDGYLFGGWYEDAAGKNPVTVEEKSGISEAYAKFVPAYILSVKAQNYAGADWTTNGDATTTTRLVTSVDCADYSEVGFELIRSDGATKTVYVKKVYNYLAVKDSADDTEPTNYSPDLVFGDGAEHFAVLEYTDIPESAWSDNTYVRPFWVTTDGTTVTGLPKYVRVDDGIKDSEGYKHISVAVNLKTAEPIAAGVVNVSYDDDQLEFDSYSVGKVFEEMEVADKGSSIKCVGNLETITDIQYADDMYISLRFKVIGNYSVMDEGGLTFNMDQIDFAANDETLTDTNVWDVLY